MSSIDQSMEFLHSFASDALNRASSLALRIPTSLVGVPISTGTFSHTVKPFAGERPPKFSDLLGSETDSSAATLQFLDNEAEKWMGKYFPELDACLRSKPEEWLCGIISGEKPFGLSREAFEAMWHEGRDRAYRAAAVEIEQIKSEFSSRGFSLPQGAMLSAITQAEIRASEAIAEVNRQQIDRGAQIKVDMLKFAEEQAIRLKLGIFGELARFYQQWVNLPDKDIERARVKAQMYASLQSALSSYHNVDLGFEQLRFQAAAARHSSRLDADKLRVDQLGHQPKGEAMASAVRGFADAASGAANAQSSFAADIVTGGA